MTDFSHLDAIDLRLSHERTRVAQAKTNKEREWREHNVRMIEQERASEIKFLENNGVKFSSIDEILSDDELLRDWEHERGESSGC